MSSSPPPTPLPSALSSACLLATLGIILLFPRPEIGIACVFLLVSSYLFLLHSEPAPTMLSPSSLPGQTSIINSTATAASKLRSLIATAKSHRRCEVLPAAHDAMTAVLIEQAGFQVAFMSGFAVSATQLAMPDMGLISYGEVLEVGRRMCEAARGVAIIGDGDTGFGGSGNIRRTIEGYARAGFAGITIEDQCYPKRCSYARGVVVVSRAQAVARIAAAVAARNEMRSSTGLDLVIVARTDCRNAQAIEGGGSSGGGRDPSEGFLTEALARCVAFEATGADVVYAEGLRSHEEMRKLNDSVGVPTLLAQVEKPAVNIIGPEEAAKLGYTLSLRGLTLLNATLSASQAALSAMATGAEPPSPLMMSFEDLYRHVGFDTAYAWEERFAEDRYSGSQGRETTTTERKPVL